MHRNHLEKGFSPFRYSGEYFDKSSNTYYLRARYYSPGIGRFISEDTYWGEAGDPLSLNLYVYCANNPIIFVDPNGNSRINAAVLLSDSGGVNSYYNYIDKEQNRMLFEHSEAIPSTTTLIDRQRSLPSYAGYGLLGNAKAHSCGAIAVHNAMLLVGDDSEFKDIYDYFDKNTNLGIGSFGTDPFAVFSYLEEMGYKVVVGISVGEEKAESVIGENDVGIMLYVKWTSKGIEAHYFALQETADGGYEVYNMPISSEDEVQMADIYDDINTELIVLYGVSK